MKLSVVIPTLNEEAYVLKTIERARNYAQTVPEIIVVDSGSTDATVDLVRSQGIKVVLRNELKGVKYALLNAGASQATGDTFLFLDADTLLPKAYDLLISEAMDPSTPGGAFVMKFDCYTLGLRVIEKINYVRYRVTRRYFGDQAIFCSGQAFGQVGGFPPRIVMEASHFCKNLRRQGRLQLIHDPVITSSRRFLEGGVLKVFWTDIRIYVRDALGLNTDRLGKKYWAFENEKANRSFAETD